MKLSDPHDNSFHSLNADILQKHCLSTNVNFSMVGSRFKMASTLDYFFIEIVTFVKQEYNCSCRYGTVRFM